MNQPTLKTERLLLRSFCLDDALEVQKLAGNYNVSKTTRNIPHPYKIEMAEVWIRAHRQGWKSRTGVVYAISLLETNQLIGAASVVRVDGTKGELGYWIGEPYWNQGYCTEAVQALVKFSFEQLNLRKVIAEHLASNGASGKVMTKVGMHHVETLQTNDRNHERATVEVYEIWNT